MTDMIVGRPSKRIFLCLALFIFPSKKIAGRVIINNEHRRVSIAGVNYITHHAFNRGFVKITAKAKEKVPSVALG